MWMKSLRSSPPVRLAQWLENAPTSTVIYTATATDAIAVTYSLSGDDAALLNIDASTGVVTLKNSADFETKSSYSFTVTATDALGNASTPQSVIVSVTDVDEVAPVFTSGTTAQWQKMLPPAPSSTPQRQPMPAPSPTA
jgi:hypothetical protein